MKKTIAAVVIAGMIAAAGSAFAVNGVRNNGMGYNPQCPQLAGKQMQVRAPQIDAAVIAKIEKFNDDNAGLRKQLAMKMAEKRALMQGDNPDPKLAATITGEIFDLHYTLKKNAEAAGVSQYVGGPMGGCMMGMGPGQGRMGCKGGKMGGRMHHGKMMHGKMMGGKMMNGPMMNAPVDADNVPQPVEAE